MSHRLGILSNVNSKILESYNNAGIMLLTRSMQLNSYHVTHSLSVLCNTLCTYKGDSQELFTKTSGFRVYPHGIKQHCIAAIDVIQKQLQLITTQWVHRFPERSPCCRSPPQVRVHPDQHHTIPTLQMVNLRNASNAMPGLVKGLK